MVQRHIGINRTALDVVWNTDHRRFGDLRMRHQRGFNFCRAQTVARDVQHVIDATGDPVITVFVTTSAVAAEVHVLKVEK